MAFKSSIQWGQNHNEAILEFLILLFQQVIISCWSNVTKKQLELNGGVSRVLMAEWLKGYVCYKKMEFAAHSSIYIIETVQIFKGVAA